MEEKVLGRDSGVSMIKKPEDQNYSVYMVAND